MGHNQSQLLHCSGVLANTVDIRMARSGTLINQVMSHIRAGIASRSILPGTRLPSIRQQARLLKMSVSPWWKRMSDWRQKALSYRPGAGFYVNGPWRRLP
jgi:DNA-binding transcriptional regulator YhcF (GntR family)